MPKEFFWCGISDVFQTHFWFLRNNKSASLVASEQRFHCLFFTQRFSYAKRNVFHNHNYDSALKVCLKWWNFKHIHLNFRMSWSFISIFFLQKDNTNYKTLLQKYIFFYFAPKVIFWLNKSLLNHLIILKCLSVFNHLTSWIT